MSTIVITYNEVTDVTSDVIFGRTSFESMVAAQPGTCEVHVRDFDQTHSFVTGKRLSMALDGVGLWTGYIFSVARTYALPVLDTSVPADVEGRIWVLRGVDVNTLFDRRIMHNSVDHLHQLPDFDIDRYDGDLIRNDLVTFLDLADDDLDTTTFVDDVAKPYDPEDIGLVGALGAWVGQGSKWRLQMEDFAQFSGAVWYIDGERNLHYHALEEAEAPWGFSDVPDGVTTIGPREVELIEDGSVIADDAMIWGGSEWAGTGQTVFAREENAASIAAYGRWQVAEVHLGQEGFKTQEGVDARADVIVNGAPGSVGGDPNRGLRFPQYDLTLVWHDIDVLANEHLTPGMIVTTSLHVWGSGTPLVLGLPLRRIRMSFPTITGTGETYVRFEGSMSLQISDPKSLWTYLNKTAQRRQTTAAVIATADPTSENPTYGSHYQGSLIPDPDGVTTVFSLDPATFAYIGGTTQLYLIESGALGGVLLVPGVDYVESDPTSGEFTLTNPPDGADALWAICRLA